MDKSQLIKAVKAKIGEAELEAALDQVISFLEKDEQYEELSRTALHLRAEYQKTARDEARGILDREAAKLSYNQVTHRLLNLLNDIEKDAPHRKARRRYRIGAVAAIVLLAVAGIWFVQNRRQPPAGNGGNAQQTAECPPQFRRNGDFKILCLPFLDYAQASFKPGISLAIRDGLNRLSLEYEINTNTGIYNLKKPDPNRYPSAPEDADGYGRNCEAQLVIWGSFEDQPDNDIVTTNWRLVGKGDGFRLRKLKVEEKETDMGSDTIETLIETWGYEVDTITSITSIANEGLTPKIKNLLLLIFGITSHQANNPRAAIAALEQVKPASEQELILRNCLLAESYLAVNQPDKALSPYDEVLLKKPNYPLALNNRALLYYQKGRYEEAAQDLSTHLEANPDDTQARLSRGTVYLKAEQLKEARQDFEAVKDKEARNPVLKNKVKELKKKEDEQVRLKENARSTLRQDPDNVKALNQLAESSRKLGDYSVAAQAAERLLARDPESKEGYQTLIKAYEGMKQFDKVQEVIQRAERSGIQPSVVLPRPRLVQPMRADTSSQ